jgi:hypothetical protein
MWSPSEGISHEMLRESIRELLPDVFFQSTMQAEKGLPPSM